MKLGLKSKLPFDKYKGDTVEKIIDNDPSYLKWIIDVTAWADSITLELNKEAQREMEKALNQREE